MRFVWVGKQQMVRSAFSSAACFIYLPTWTTHAWVLLRFRVLSVLAECMARRGVGKSACLSALCLLFHLPIPLDISNVHHPWLILSQPKWVRPRSQMKVSGLRNLHISAITRIMSSAEAWWGQKAGSGPILNEKCYLEQKSHVLLHHPEKHERNIKTTWPCVEGGCGIPSYPLSKDLLRRFVMTFF